MTPNEINNIGIIELLECNSCNGKYVCIKADSPLKKILNKFFEDISVAYHMVNNAFKLDMKKLSTRRIQRILTDAFEVTYQYGTETV